MGRQWRARPGSRITNKQAQIIGDTMDRMSESDTEVTPHNLVAWVKRHRSSPVAGLFTWDRDEAAERWLVHQARNFIESVQVITVEERRVKGFHSIEFVNGRGSVREYVRHDLVLESDEALDQVSDSLYHDIGVAVRKAADLGLTRRSRSWRAIERAVNTNPP